MTITNEHALALIALQKALEGGERGAITAARMAVAKHEAEARRALLTPAQQAKLALVTENIGTLLAHTHAVPSEKEGRVRFVIDPEFIHLTFKETPQ